MLTGGIGIAVALTKWLQLSSGCTSGRYTDDYDLGLLYLRNKFFCTISAILLSTVKRAISILNYHI